MKDLIKVAVILTLIDVVYLKLIGGGPFIKMVEKIQKKEVKMNMISAVIAYVLLIASVYLFIIKKNFSNKEAFLLGAITYGIFDATNMALFSEYDPIIAIQDSIWGGVLFLLTTVIYRKLKK